MTKVAEEFNVSSSYMARICSTLNVPRPQRGYWAKLQVGKAPSPDLLPAARPGDQLFWTKDGEVRTYSKPRASLEQIPKPQVRIPRENVHGLIGGAKAHYENSRPVDDGAYLKPFKKLLVDITSSKACLDKALGFANDLFNAFESVGHRVTISPQDERLRRAAVDEREARGTLHDPCYHTGPWAPYRPTVVYVGSVAIGLALVEMSEVVLLRYVRGKYIRDADYIPPKPSRLAADHTWATTRALPSGRLRLVAYSPDNRVNWSTDWQETTKVSLRAAIKSIIASIEYAAADLVRKLEDADRKAEIARQEWLAAEERRKKEEDRRQVEQSIRESREHLGQVIQQWSSALSVEMFLEGVENRAAALLETDKAAVRERLTLAREFLGSQDPLDFFMSWKTPGERYRPIYPKPEGSPRDDTDTATT